MKDYIVVFFVVLAISCFLNSPSMPVSMPVGVSGTVDATGGTKRSDVQIPEANFTDATANSTQLTGIDDSSNREQSSSQNGSNF